MSLTSVGALSASSLFSRPPAQPRARQAKQPPVQAFWPKLWGRQPVPAVVTIREKTAQRVAEEQQKAEKPVKQPDSDTFARRVPAPKMIFPEHHPETVEKLGPVWKAIHKNLKAEPDGPDDKTIPPFVALVKRASAEEMNAKDAEGFTPLSEGAFYGRQAQVKVLLNDPRTDLLPPTRNGWTPLVWAAAKGRIYIVKPLLEAVQARRLDLNAHQQMDKALALSKNNPDMTRTLKQFAPGS